MGNRTFTRTGKAIHFPSSSKASYSIHGRSAHTHIVNKTSVKHGLDDNPFINYICFPTSPPLPSTNVHMATTMEDHQYTQRLKTQCSTTNLATILTSSYHFLRPYILIILVISATAWIAVLLTKRVRVSKSGSRGGSPDPEKPRNGATGASLKKAPERSYGGM